MLNWKLRLKNKTTLIALIGTLAALVYQVLGAFGVAPGISEDTVLEIAGLAINVMCLLGIVVDPTTEGVGDSDRALGYDELGGKDNYSKINE